MFHNLVVFLTVFFSWFCCFGACNPNIAEAVKREYAADMYTAFVLQSQGESITSFCYFDVGYEKAKKAGEEIQKLNILRQYFVWYRTYGYFLGLISKPTGIVGEYKGSSCKARQPHGFGYGSSPEKNAKIRDFLFGVSEVIAGATCVYFLPSWETKLGFGAPLIYSGVERIWGSVNDFWLQRDISIIELQRISNSAKASAQ